MERVNLLDEQHRAESTEATIQAPLTKMPIVVSVLDIEAYEDNPRKSTNHRFLEIKESIRNSGLQQPFVITQKPGQDGYMTKSGGNTRLQALKELYSETQDERFKNLNLVFEPWVSESDTLISHLTENDLRGDLTLIDRALGINAAREKLEEELGRPLSGRELSSALGERGYTISHVNINILMYAVSIYEYLPKALHSGIGSAVITKIRKFENQCREVYQQLKQDIESLPHTFNRSLKESDANDWIFDDLVDVFIENSAEDLNESISTLDFHIKRALEDKKPSKEEIETTPNTPEFDSIEEHKSNQESHISNDEEQFSSSDVPFVDDSIESEESNHYENDSVHEFVINDSEIQEDLSDKPLELLRKQALDLAVEIANEADIQDLIIKVDDGYGWILANIPQHIHLPNGWNEQDPAFHNVWKIWFGLFQLSGCTSSKWAKAIASHIPEENNDLRFLLNGEWDRLKDGMYVTTAAVTTDFFLTSTAQSTFELISTHRSIAKIQDNLWTGGAL